MQWNCPHCWGNLAIPDEDLPEGWVFSKCCKCSSLALIRKGARNIIKVDSAPKEERVLLTADPEYLAQSAERSQTPLSSTEPPTTSSGMSVVEAPFSAAVEESSLKPVIRPAGRRGFLGRRSGEEVASVIPPSSNPISRKTTEKSEEKFQNFTFPEALPEPPPGGGGHRALPVLIGITGAIAVGSAVFLLVQGLALSSPPKKAASASPLQPPIQTLQTSAIAPKKPALSDQLHQQAMAPVRAGIAPALLVQPKSGGANLRQGPGTVFGIAGTANMEARYIVVDWSDRWFKVIPENQDRPGQASGWIRTDTVKVVTQDQEDEPGRPSNDSAD